MRKSPAQDTRDSVRGIACRAWVATLLLCAVILATPSPASAQQAKPSRFAIDTAAAIDHSVDGSGNHATGIMVDAIVSVGLGRGFEAVVWPIAQRIANTGNESADIWIATLRYERAGAVGVRIDGGLLGSPVGLANLTVRRPHLNPTISQPASLFSPLPAAGSPRSAWKPSRRYLSIRRTGDGVAVRIGTPGRR